MPYRMSRAAYADMFGPTTGDRLRLADTNLIIEIERDFTILGEEVKFGGGKVIRDGMGQSQITNAAGAAVRIDNWAHIGGALGGLVLAFGIAPLFIVRSHPEIPGHLIADDINPLRRRLWAVSAYVVVLMLILIFARQTYVG